MKLKLNRRGYVLVEIILASVIAFGIAYYMLDLTIKLKNKNDDILAKTLVKTDRAIIQNKLYKYISEDNDNLYEIDNNEVCNHIKSMLTINNNVIKYNGELIDIVNEYTTIGTINCNFNNSTVHISIPLSIEPLNKNFDVTLDYILRKPIPTP